jgi:hypothetical protein
MTVTIFSESSADSESPFIRVSRKGDVSVVDRNSILHSRNRSTGEEAD